MTRVAIVLLLVATQVVWGGVKATTYLVSTRYAGTDCSGTPYSVDAYEAFDDSECSDNVCLDSSDESEDVSAEMISTGCTSDYLSAMREKFGDSPYILQAQFLEEGCETLSTAYGYPALGNCEGSFYQNNSNYVVGKLGSNGTASIQIFNDTKCLSESLFAAFDATKTTLDSHSCDSNYFKWYSSKDDVDSSSSGSTAGSSGLSSGAIIGIICGCIAALLIISGLLSFAYVDRRGRTEDN